MCGVEALHAQRFIGTPDAARGAGPRLGAHVQQLFGFVLSCTSCT